MLLSMRSPFVFCVLFCSLAIRPHISAQQATAPAHAATRITEDLRVFLIDVEGGQATLFVTPAGESLLIDTGWPGRDGRDAGRIVAAAHSAGLRRIDYVLITHYHDDHVGGVPQLVQRMPVGTFLDHGTLYETGDPTTANDHKLYQQQLATGQSKHLTLHVGDTFPLRSLQATVISSDGQVIGKPLDDAGIGNGNSTLGPTRVPVSAGAGLQAGTAAGAANPECATDPAMAEDKTENGHSLGVLIRFAGVRILDLGDLTKDRERMLVCPANRIGHVDIDIVSHHGWEQSSSPSFIHAIHPRIAIMDNGATKGGSTPVLDVFRNAPGLETLWQLHTSEEGAAKNGSPEHNTGPEYIANTPGMEGKMLELTVHADGSYEVKNDRTGQVKNYDAKH